MATSKVRARSAAPASKSTKAGAKRPTATKRSVTKAATSKPATPKTRASAGTKQSGSKTAQPASQLIDAKIRELNDWRGKLLARLRALIKEADPEVVEEWKWSTPVWSHGGILCTGETYKSTVKMTFAKGASLKDPAGLFNSSLEGNVRRAIDIREGEEVNEAALKALIRAAAALNKA